MISGTANGHVPFTQTDCAGWVGEIRMKKRIISVVLSMLMMLGTVPYAVTAAGGGTDEYPELMITQIGVDQYGSRENAANTNPKYNEDAGNNPNADVYEFISVYNNSDRELNVYDYMIGYQGASPAKSPDFFERSIQCYTPLYPGADWADAPFAAYDSYWKKSSVVRPVNLARENGKIKPGETFVIWVYTAASHRINCTLEQFRSFWCIPDGTKVFILDGNDVDGANNFKLKNDGTGTYIIMHGSERFPARRSADKKFDVERDNKRSPYTEATYETLDEVISWAVVDFGSEPLASVRKAEGGEAKTNRTVSYLPAAEGQANGSFASNKRMHISKVNDYASSAAGRLDDAQKAALSKTKTAVVRTVPSSAAVAVNDNKRPSLIITEIAADQYGGASALASYKESPNLDPFECFEMYNNSTSPINVFDYMLGYQGCGATSVSTWFERSIQEYTPIFPGADWTDAPWGEYDKYWTGAEASYPINPSYTDGVIAPGETFVLWCYSQDSHKCRATVEDLRTFWKIPDGVKVFLIDGNSEREKNFNIKNSATGEYIVMKPSERFSVRRGDDETYATECDRSDFYYYDKNFSDMPEIISWAVVDFGCYDPLYSFRLKNGESSSKNNYTVSYAPYNGEEVFTNGFTTVTFETQKRMHLAAVNEKYSDTHIGKLSDAQKDAILKATSR